MMSNSQVQENKKRAVMPNIMIQHNSLTVSYKEELLLSIEALKNLMKRYSFLELNYQLATEQITDEEYDKELEENESKYVIAAPTKKANMHQIAGIGKIVESVGVRDSISVEDVEELFGLKIDEDLLKLEAMEKSETKLLKK